jgi:hypothetical protein
MDAAQAMKDMHRERLTVNGPEVPSTDVPILLFDLIHDLLEKRLEVYLASEEKEKEKDQVEGTTKKVEASEEGGGMEPGTAPPPASSSSAAAAAASSNSNSILSVAEGGASSSMRHMKPHSSLTEHLVMRVINAASRTSSGGDAFFIVQVESYMCVYWGGEITSLLCFLSHIIHNFVLNKNEKFTT